MRWSSAAFRLDATGAAGAPRDLTASIESLYAHLGLPFGTAARAQLDEAAAALPDAVRAPFADLVATVVGTYGPQAEVGRAVAARLAAGFDPRVPLLTASEREATAARATAIASALARFRARTRSRSAAHRAQTLLVDPEGLVVLGGTGNDTYRRSGTFPDPILLVDQGGNDTYLNSAGGACPVPTLLTFGWLECNMLAVSVVADLGGGADAYGYDGPPAAVQGAGGPGGLGMLIDAGGNDSYTATMTRSQFEPFQYFDGGAQGYGYAGVGVIDDEAGKDVYRFDVLSKDGQSVSAFAQGFGGGGGLGVAIDRAGADQWLSNGLGLVGQGFQGLYTVGVGFYGGVGVATDLGTGDDVYRAIDRADNVDFYAFGFAAFGGAGVLYDEGGNDSYYTLEEAQSIKPTIDPLLNCAFGTASFGGVGVMVEGGGNDTYYGASISTSGASVMDSGFGGPGIAYGAFIDVSGDDSYTMEAVGTHTMISGRGLFELSSFTNTWGAFADLGGKDSYVGGYGKDDDVWAFGIDRD